jgi:hypothetical protein
MMKELNLEERYNKRAFRPRGKEIELVELTWFIVSWGFQNWDCMLHLLRIKKGLGEELLFVGVRRRRRE